jgi:DNA-binding MarR family transcriptional regulator
MPANPSRDDLTDQILDHLQMMGPEIDRMGGAAAASMGLNRTDLRALQVLRTSTGLTAGELARALRITSGATTRVIDSLVRSGHVLRAAHPEDRRRVVVRLTPGAAREVDQAFERLRRQTRELLTGYADAELELLARFLADTRGLLRLNVRRLSREGRALRAARDPGAVGEG